jgi:hypothetical protein
MPDNAVILIFIRVQLFSFIQSFCLYKIENQTDRMEKFQQICLWLRIVLLCLALISESREESKNIKMTFLLTICDILTIWQRFKDIL